MDRFCERMFKVRLDQCATCVFYDRDNAFDYPYSMNTDSLCLKGQETKGKKKCLNYKKIIGCLG